MERFPIGFILLTNSIPLSIVNLVFNLELQPVAKISFEKISNKEFSLGRPLKKSR